MKKKNHRYSKALSFKNASGNETLDMNSIDIIDLRGTQNWVERNKGIKISLIKQSMLLEKDPWH